MECRELNERLVDRLTGQIRPEAEEELALHLAACAGCAAQAPALERAWEFLGEDSGLDATPEFRRRSRLLIEEEMLRMRVREFRPKPRALRWVAQAAAILVAAGIGYFAASRRVPLAAAAVSRATAASPLPDFESNPRLSNLSYQPVTPDGRVGIGFDVTTRHTVEGSPSDPEVARLLAYLLSRNTENSGEKSRAIELVQQHYGAGVASASPDIVNALTSTLRKDPNPGVRKKAADALSSMRMTPEIRSAFLEALHGDRNPAVRLVAIESLAAAAKESPADPKTIQSLRERAFDPSENGFVRARAASALKTMEF
jgi:hypothetical protein